MNKRPHRLSWIKRGPWPYVLLGAAFLLLHILYNPLAEGFIRQNLRLLSLLGAVCMVIIGVILYLCGKLTTARAAALVMAIGLIVRICYVLQTGVYVRQHDVDRLEDFGHWGYIFHFTNSWRLPQTNTYQFYHPPLHHALAALCLRANALFRMDLPRSLESVQYLTAFYSACFMVVAYRVFRELKLRGIPLIAATALVALHPTLFILSGSVNNDMLAILLYAAAFLWLLRWWARPETKNTVALALCMGFGMMAKTNMATCAFVIAPFFLIKLLQRAPRNEKCALIARFALFGAISLPLGLWHALRNLAVLGQPLGFVPVPGGPQYKGTLSLWQRFAPFPPAQIFNRPHASPWEDGNLSIYLLKSSLFGEWEVAAQHSALAYALLALNLALILLSVAALLYILVRKRKNFGMGAWMLSALWVVQLIFMVYFYLSYPYGCTMDFRYMVPTLLCGAGFLGMALQGQGSGVRKALQYMVTACIFCFCALSAFLYLVI
ncbi:MAG: glycosyltransferase family 39 protein [Clostridiales bacterium]|nr:glycosyltransferase family 39 protein [Clostridiales bacterium]